MTKLDPFLPLSLARERQFYSIVKTYINIGRAGVIKLMNCSMGTFQHEYTSYLQTYPQIKYNKKKREFVFDP